jgi:hypothetical protein
MRKAFGIVLGCILLCGLVVAAMVAAPEQQPPPTTIITINGDEATDGVDTPWFDWKYNSGATVQWVNSTPYPCQIIFFQGNSPISAKAFHIGPKPEGAPAPTSEVYPLDKAPAPPAGWPTGKVYKLYKYKVVLVGHRTPEFDPGGGPRPGG